VADESANREILVAQLEGDLAGIAFLAATAATGSPAPSPEPAPLTLPAWVDEAMLAEFHEAQRFGLTEVEELFLEPDLLGESERQRIARILHTLKGESGTVGFAGLERLYHALEDHLLAAPELRAVADDVFAVKDWVLSAVPALVAGRGEPPGREALLARLGPASAHGAAPSPERDDPGTDEDLHPEPLAPGHAPTDRLPSDPESIALFGEFHDESQESLAQADELLISLESGTADPATVDALFRIFHTIKGLAGFLDMGSIGALAHAAETLLSQAREDLATFDDHRVDLVLRTTVMVRTILTSMRQAIGTDAPPPPASGLSDLLDALTLAQTGGAGQPRPARRPVAPAPEPRPVAEVAAAPASDPSDEDVGGPRMAPRAAAEPEKPADGAPEGGEGGAPALLRETIKVDLARVDSLVETIGELVILEAMVTSGLSSASQRTRQQMAQMSKIVRDLQRQGLALRMVPLRGVFQKMSRLVRDLSRRSGKPIQLELSGQDAEMDRSLAERLGDPLVHMIRNGVDHGIEPIEVRRAAGKPDLATLRLRAFHEGGNIVIELSDDGKGLDRDAILARAVSRGLVPAGAQLADRDVYELIFAPGFSTAEKVTELSGRGVGMDVVKRTVEELRGRIQISTEKGKGTTFRLVLPLTLAIIDGMLLTVGGAALRAAHLPADFVQRFASRLAEVLRSEVVVARGAEVCRPGLIVVSPATHHLRVRRQGSQLTTELFAGAPVNQHVPSCDVLLSSVAKACGGAAVGLILTGMGSDGARGLLEMRRAGAATLAQDEATSVVFGMPRAARDLGAVDELLPLPDLARRAMERLAEPRERRRAV
jgi:two-component system chemotaxis sensor kinase CheA